jgi:hypothetical protein
VAMPKSSQAQDLACAGAATVAAESLADSWIGDTAWSLTG